MIEKELLEIIKKEVEKYLKNSTETKETVKIIGYDNLIKNELEKKFTLCEEAKKIIITNLKIPELISLSQGSYTNDISQEILNHILKSHEIFIIKEGVEWRSFENIPEPLYKKYSNCENNLKEYGVKFIKKIELLESLNSDIKKNYFNNKLLNLRYVKNISEKEIIISEDTIITQLALDYIRENNIKIIRRG